MGESWEEEVYTFSKKAHHGQEDDSGLPYFDAHILQVVQLVKQVTNDKSMISAAYLHDTIEDTDVTYEDVESKFGPAIAGLVMELTHEGAKDTYGFYFPRLISREAIVVKFADRMSNLSRMQAWDGQRRAQYLRKSTFWKNGRDREKVLAWNRGKY